MINFVGNTNAMLSLLSLLSPNLCSEEIPALIFLKSLIAEGLLKTEKTFWLETDAAPILQASAPMGSKTVCA